MLYCFRVMAALALISCGNAAAGGALQFSMWGGVYAEVYAQRLLYPYYRKSGITVMPSAKADTSAIDVVELGLHEAQAQCDDGSLMYLPPAVFSGLSGSINDFVPNALQPCAVGQLVWSTVVAFQSDGNTSRQSPAHADDFFNTDAFPGARILHKSPKVLFVWALASSGIPPDRIYEVLQDIDSARELIEKQLRRIEGNVVWVDSDEEAFRYLNAGDSAFAAVSSSSVMQQALLGNEPQVIWDSALFEMSLLGIPVNAAMPELASEFIRHVVTHGNLQAVSADLGLATARYSTTEMMNSEFADYLPTRRLNSASSIWLDATWWQSKSADNAIALFVEWVDKVDSLQQLALVETINLTAQAD